MDESVSKIADALTAPGPFQGMPVWTKIVGYIGFPIMVASSLLWVFTDQIRNERLVLIEHNEVMKKHADVADRIGTATLRTLSQICANGAQTKEDRDACATVVIPQAPIIEAGH